VARRRRRHDDCRQSRQQRRRAPPITATGRIGSRTMGPSTTEDEDRGVPVQEEAESVWERINVRRERCRVVNINLPLDPSLHPPDGTPLTQVKGGQRTLMTSVDRCFRCTSITMIYVKRPSWLLYGQKGASVGSKFSIRPVTSNGQRCWLSIDAFSPRPLLPSAGRGVFIQCDRSAHKNPLVTNRILMAGHRLCFVDPSGLRWSR
jgi:hypothetical protein